MIKLNELKNPAGSKKERIRIGRGIGSGKGKTGGRGGKGQTARSGVSGIRGVAKGQTSYIKRLPKRGFSSLNHTVYAEVNLKDLNRLVEAQILKAGDTVDVQLLVEHGLIRNANLPVKLLGTGNISTSLNIDLEFASAKARELILAAGGQFKNHTA